LYNQQVNLPLLTNNEIQLFVKREDQIHPFISGNKFRKLKYNLVMAKTQGFDSILTFGGAFSNHIAATAYAGIEQGFKTIGVIRGEELRAKADNVTLAFAKSHGMELDFVDRAQYRKKDLVEFIEGLRRKFGNFYLIPEGGTNELAVRGCEEILEEQDADFDYVCVAVGTGGTISGLINSLKGHQHVLGFPALRGDFLPSEIRKFARSEQWGLINDYHFGGYAKINRELIEFINQFKQDTSIPLDPVYTGKMMYGILDLVKDGYFRSPAKILAIHTGGLQGIQGMNQILKRKNLPLLT
jgi:1-aminocyclopropane-1-carboxylate deaminase